MDKIYKVIENVLYQLSGRNFDFYNTESVFNKMAETCSESFFYRKITDVGCGDGKNSLRIAKILKAKAIVGREISSRLVVAANNRGLRTIKMEVGEKISGDLGILWGVVHHMTNPQKELKKLIKNFNCLLIREPSNKYRIFEAGKRFSRDEIDSIVNKAVEGSGKKIVKVEDKVGTSFLYYIK